MIKKVGIALGAVIAVYLVAWAFASPLEKVKAGETIQPMTLTSIHDKQVNIPSPNSRWVHLQFRRFAGCPICNLHMQHMLSRYQDIEAAGIKEVVIFHSPKESLLPFQGKFPFDVIADPDKKLYEQFGVGTSVFAVLDVRVWPAIVKGISQENKPTGDSENGALGLPADFLINSEGKVVASHYGAHAYDQWSVDELLALAK